MNIWFVTEAFLIINTNNQHIRLLEG